MLFKIIEKPALAASSSVYLATLVKCEDSKYTVGRNYVLDFYGFWEIASDFKRNDEILLINFSAIDYRKNGDYYFHVMHYEKKKTE